MKKILLSFIIVLVSVSASLSAIPASDVSSESIAALLYGNGYSAYVDEDGDVTVEDQYGMDYWIIPYADENRIWIQSGWSAADDVKSSDANRIVNECNNNLFLIRCSYSSMYRTFYCDYDFCYSDSGFDDALLISIIDYFFSQADIYTDYLIGEGMI